MGILYFAEIVTLGELFQNTGARAGFGGDEEMGIAAEDFDKGGTIVEA